MLFVPHEAPLHRARLLQRRDRFLADVVLDATGEQDVAYCVNPGRMEAFSAAGARIWLLPAPSCAAQEPEAGQVKRGARRLRWTWELIEHAGILCCANTQRANAVAGAMLRGRLLPGLDTWVELASERTVPAPPGGPDQRGSLPGECSAGGTHKEEESDQAHSGTGTGGRHSLATTHEPKSRLDFWLRGKDGDEHFIEVKNCHMVYPDGNGYFPDSVSSRASRHMAELSSLACQGHHCTVLFVVARGDLRGVVRPSAHHDPNFARACRSAAAMGVRFRALRVACGLDGFTVESEAPVDVAEYDTAPVAAWVLQARDTTGWIRSQSRQRVANRPFPHEAAAARARAAGASYRPRPRRREADGAAKPPARVRKSASKKKLPVKPRRAPFAVALAPSTSVIDL